jgi:hypothetical protein
MPAQTSEMISFTDEAWRGVATVAGTGAAMLIGQSPEIPSGIGGLIQALGVTGVLIWFLYHLVTNTIPRMIERADRADDRAEKRLEELCEEHKAERAETRAHYERVIADSDSRHIASNEKLGQQIDRLSDSITCLRNGELEK